MSHVMHYYYCVYYEYTGYYHFLSEHFFLNNQIKQESFSGQKYWKKVRNTHIGVYKYMVIPDL